MLSCKDKWLGYFNISHFLALIFVLLSIKFVNGYTNLLVLWIRATGTSPPSLFTACLLMLTHCHIARRCRFLYPAVATVLAADTSLLDHLCSCFFLGTHSRARVLEILQESQCSPIRACNSTLFLILFVEPKKLQYNLSPDEIEVLEQNSLAYLFQVLPLPLLFCL
ncbi:uncharacterized protein LOC111016974 [Momordica charantia]|uniref:Uncharacterized protein LOC111016974 n=1 Tax=Momordica charantia TaxID=3673 RepID=A0A6J1D4N3_MOMCH|nr:uncharacterized protein LOC111016974 [Momordica charantia]XP_022148282.1 uncharacterized protein LOC111016974 [Momordica charantia]XP_022148283.1 uncharacterized protein LOC111016974 [Momordica charantia]